MQCAFFKVQTDRIGGVCVKRAQLMQYSGVWERMYLVPLIIASDGSAKARGDPFRDAPVLVGYLLNGRVLQKGITWREALIW